MQQEKLALRKSIVKKLNELPHETYDEYSERIARHLVSSPIWNHMDCILCFISMPEEIETESIIQQALDEGKTVGVPRMRGDEMDFLRITTLDVPWDIHSFGIKEPPLHYPRLNPRNWERDRILTVTPGLAFDRKGGRLGRGGGFYDRFFSKEGNHTIAIGVCFSFQLVEDVPVDHHDCLISGVVTEEGLFPSECCPPELLDSLE